MARSKRTFGQVAVSLNLLDDAELGLAGGVQHLAHGVGLQ